MLCSKKNGGTVSNNTSHHIPPIPYSHDPGYIATKRDMSDQDKGVLSSGAENIAKGVRDTAEKSTEAIQKAADSVEAIPPPFYSTTLEPSHVQANTPFLRKLRAAPRGPWSLATRTLSRRSPLALSHLLSPNTRRPRDGLYLHLVWRMQAQNATDRQQRLVEHTINSVRLLLGLALIDAPSGSSEGASPSPCTPTTASSSFRPSLEQNDRR